MTTSQKLTDVLLAAEWLQVTPGERFKIRTSVKETEGAYSMLEFVADPGNGVPMHIHKNEDEHFIILEGSLHIAVGGKISDAPAGTSVTVMRGVPHAWCNLSDSPVRMLAVYSPGHIEELLKAIATRQSNDELPALAQKFGLVVTGPTPA
jgi:mannose-6-phosphate isomerase-like protein (cupin superfamily)